MEESKSIGKLLKELNDMQLRFDNLNEELIITKNENKKRTVKTDLVSDKIDTDFFKTLTAPTRKKTNNKQPKTPSENISEDALLFSLDTKSENVSSVVKKKETLNINNKETKVVNKSILPEKLEVKAEKSIEKEKNVKNKEDILKDTNLVKKTPLKKDLQITKSIKDQERFTENTYLSIKQKLEKIKTEISVREVELIKEKGKVTPLITTTKPSIISTALAPAKKETKKVDVVKQTENVEKKVADLKKDVAKKISTENNKTTINQPEKKRNTVDMLTIIILVLLIVLITTAWILLK